MKPLLCLLGQRGVMGLGEAVDQLADDFGLTAEDRAVLLPSGQYPLFRSRVGWAKTYLKQAGLLVQPKRGLMELSAEGRRLSASPPERIDNAFLTQYESFRDFMMRSGTRPTASSKPEDATPADESVVAGSQDGSAAPEEVVEQAIHLLHEELRSELLDTVKTASPAFFERLVVQLLLRMGYGGSRQEAGEAVGRSGDGGIDGIINEDRLGLDAIYLQAKRWEGAVGEGPIRDFKGALDAKGAQKGVFITTSSFTPAAKEAARNSRSYKIVLIDGARLAELMIEHDLGVSVAATYQLKRIDSDFFADE
jgi:restriction system protein